jgi:two-component system response regulator MtrA
MTGPGLGRRVLLVEDAAEVRLLLQVVLEADGFVVSEAVDGPSGIGAARDERPDVVLLDVQLPGLDGREVP